MLTESPNSPHHLDNIITISESEPLHSSVEKWKTHNEKTAVSDITHHEISISCGQIKKNKLILVLCGRKGWGWSGPIASRTFRPAFLSDCLVYFK